MSTAGPKLFPPFRVDHVGSLRRLTKLLQRRKELQEGKTTLEELMPLLRLHRSIIIAGIPQKPRQR